jgi:hypothetical protein
MVDSLASEYGWTPDQIIDLPSDVAAQLIHAILYRKGVKVWKGNPTRDESAPSLSERLNDIFNN